MIRVVLPPHLRRLARVDGEVAVQVQGPVTQRSVLDALEARYPMLRGTIRDQVTRERRAYMRFFACTRDLSHDPPDAPLPEDVGSGKEPLYVIGAIAGGERAHDVDGAGAWTRYLVPVGRVLFAAAHAVFSPLNFSREAIAMAGQAGVPLPGLVVPLAAVISLAGGLSVMLGYRAKVGAWLLVVFLVPVTFYLHNFWAVKDPTIAQFQEGFFIANLSRIGAALLIAHFGAGPFSLDARAQSRRV